jgi:AraC-like DNA-binding protein
MESTWSPQQMDEDLAACLAVEPAFTSPLFRMVHWCCRAECDALARERHHPWLVLCLPRSGASVIRTGGRPLLLDPGCAVLHAPLSGYTTAHPFGCGDRGWNVAIFPETLGALGIHETPSALADRVTAVPGPELMRWRLELERWRRDAAGEPAAVEEATLALLGKILARLAATRRPARRPGRADTELDHERVFERARAEILRRYREPLRLGELGRAACASPYHLCRVFKRASGMSVLQYVNRLRLLAALDAVAERDVSLTDLAADLGFSSHSHFTQAFRRELGVTPSELRQQATGRRITASRRILGRTV